MEHTHSAVELNEGVRLSPEVRLLPGNRLEVTIFGVRGEPHVEVRTLQEWAERWQLELGELAARLRDPKGCWPVSALKLPQNARWAYLIRRDGYEGRSVKEIAESLGIQVQALLARLRLGWPVERAVATPARLMVGRPRAGVPAMRERYKANEAPFEFRGVFATMREHCERLGLNYTTVVARTFKRTNKVKRADGTTVVHVYPGLSKQDALAAGKVRKRRTRSDKGVSRPFHVARGTYKQW